MKKLIAALTSAVFVSGCASTVAAKYDMVSVTSEPSGAEVMVNGHPSGHTPTSVAVEKRLANNTVVTIQMAGHESQQCRLSGSPGVGYVVADAIWCVALFPIGCVAFVDAGGAWNIVDQQDCAATLRPSAPPPQQPVAGPNIL